MKQMYKLTWKTVYKSRNSGYRKCEQGYYKIYENIGHVKSAISNVRRDWSGKVWREGIDYTVEVCEIPEYEEIWKPFELGDWETADEKWRRKRGLDPR